MSRRSSLGDFSSSGSFRQAFRDAHSNGGPGHSFSYQGELYTTNCADGRDYRTQRDDYTAFQHRVHEYGHDVNAYMKDHGYGSLDRMPVYGRSNTSWSSDLDRQRAMYHRNEAKKKEEAAKQTREEALRRLSDAESSVAALKVRHQALHCAIS